MTGIKQRLVQIADYYNLSMRKFEEECQLSRGNISNMSDNASIGSDKLSKIIVRFSDISLDWLISGNGQMLRDKPISRPMSYTQQDPAQISAVSDVATAYKASEGIPLIPIEAMAGVLSGNSDTIMEYECEHYVIPMFKGAELLIPVRGDSMQPRFCSGDVVACKRLSLDTFFQWNKPYVIDSEQGVIIKRVKPGQDNEHLTMVSDNPEYPPFTIERAQIYSLALVIGVVRTE